MTQEHGDDYHSMIELRRIDAEIEKLKSRREIVCAFLQGKLVEKCIIHNGIQWILCDPAWELDTNYRIAEYEGGESKDKQQMKEIQILNARSAQEELRVKNQLIEAFLSGKKLLVMYKSDRWEPTSDPDWSLPSRCFRIVKEDIKVGDTVKLRIGDRTGIVHSVFIHKLSGAYRCVIECPDGICYIQNWADVIPIN